MNPLQEKIESAVKKFREKVWNERNSCFLYFADFEEVEKEYRETLEEVYKAGEGNERKAFGGCTWCYGKGYGTSRIGTSSRYHSEIHEEIVPCVKCSRGKEIEKIKEKWIKEGEKNGLSRAVEAVRGILDDSFAGEIEKLRMELPQVDEDFEDGGDEEYRERRIAVENQKRVGYFDALRDVKAVFVAREEKIKEAIKAIELLN